MHQATIRFVIAAICAAFLAGPGIVELPTAQAEAPAAKKKKRKKRRRGRKSKNKGQQEEKNKADTEPDKNGSAANGPKTTATKISAGGGKAPSSTLARALKLYDAKKYTAASQELYKVITKQTRDSRENQQRAEFVMGKSLFQMGYYAASLAYFDKIVSVGASHPSHPPTLKWLAALSRVLPETAGILEKIGTYDDKALEQKVLDEVRDELYYLLGRHYFRRAGEGDFAKAIKLFSRVAKKSPFYVKAKFFEAVTYVRQDKGRPAVAAFKDILVIGQERPDYYSDKEIQQFEELANLQMARIFYSNGKFDTAIKYFEKIPQRSPDWLESLFEASWAYYQRGNNGKALGNVHTLTAPFFEDEFFVGMAEAVLLKAVIFYQYCLYERALESVAEYNAVFRPLRRELKAILAKYEDDAEFFAYVRKVFAGEAGLDEKTQRLTLSALGDRTLRKNFDWVTELDSEITQHSKAEKTWSTTAIGGEVLQELTVQKSLAEADAGRLARERLERLSEELRQLSRDGSKIKIETLEKQGGRVEAKARGEQISRNIKTEPIEVDDEHFMWKFNGEYWKDELGFYRFKIRSECPVDATKP